MKKKQVVLGITGSIAAYKAADIANILVNANCDVHVVMTKAGAAFVTPLTLQTLTKNHVYVDVLQEQNPSEVVHIALAQKADLFLIAPATANVIGKLAWGIADDMLTSTALAMRDTKKMIAPAMNTNMYENPVVQENLKILETRGFQVIEPRESMLACGTIGKGALASVDTVVTLAKEALGI